jgi:hypothetical protein
MWRKKSESPLSPRHGILPPETFAVKSMEVNSNLLRLKLDMVYRDLPLEEAEKRFAEITSSSASNAAAPPEEMTTRTVVKPKRKTVKAFVPKNK